MCCDTLLNLQSGMRHFVHNFNRCRIALWIAYCTLTNWFEQFLWNNNHIVNCFVRVQKLARKCNQSARCSVQPKIDSFPSTKTIPIIFSFFFVSAKNIFWLTQKNSRGHKIKCQIQVEYKSRSVQVWVQGRLNVYGFIGGNSWDIYNRDQRTTRPDVMRY